MIFFLGVGLWSARHKSADAEDYLLAGRNVSPWLTALSAVATNNSGFMFIGLIGLTYASGLSSIWIMVGWIAGDYCAWRWFYPGLRRQSAAGQSRSLPEFISVETSGAASRNLARLAALVLLLFLGVYAAAQLKAGSKALHVLFGWDYHWGATLGALIIVAYCYAGGLRASIWTDAAQSAVMLGSMALLLTVALLEVGGPAGLAARLESIDPAMADWRPANLEFGFAAYLLSWVVAGIGVTGQPHIATRIMAIRSPEDLPRARRIYFTWYVAFALLCVAVGLAGRALAPTGGFDPELALPNLTAQLLPDALVGLTLAGLFAATMSTADSQTLACSAAITNDLFPSVRESYLANKLATLGAALIIYLIATSGDQSVFALVVDAWAALAAAFGPALMLRATRRPTTAGTTLAMIGAGLATTALWRLTPASVQSSLYAVLPGMAAGGATYILARSISRLRDRTTE